MNNIIITGVNGQDGSYLCKLLLKKGFNVVGIVRSSKSDLFRLEYLNIKDLIMIKTVDMTKFQDVFNIISEIMPVQIYNLSAQSSVSNSINKPYDTLNYNYVSTLNILESIRLIDVNIKFYQASSSEMFGRIDKLPIVGDELLNPVSPYGVSKAAAHLITKNYRNIYGMFACSGILFNHESYLRSKDFFIKKVIRDSLRISLGELNHLAVGNVEIKRDFGLAENYVEAMFLIMQNEYADDFLVCSGKSTKLKDIIYYIFSKFGISRNKLIIDNSLFRPSEIEDIYGDISRTKSILNWKYDLSIFDMLDRLIEEEINEYQIRIK